MDLNEIKKIIESDGGKFIFIEDGKPSIVITSFQDYKKKLFVGKNETKELNELKSEVKPIVKEERIPQELEEEALKIEDLPL